MAHPTRSVVAMPMVVDGGNAGLEQSRHHSNAGLVAQNPTHENTRPNASGNKDKGSDREIDEIQIKIISMVQSGIAKEVKGIIERLV